MEFRGHPITAARLVGGAKDRITRRFLGGYWVRVVLNKQIAERLDRIGTHTLDAVEVSGTLHASRQWKSYTTVDYPRFDLCNPPSGFAQYDVVLCEQVLEHVVDPWKATETLADLARPGGYVLVSTPFLIRIHQAPGDYWRFTPDGLRILLQRAGLEDIYIGAWGNERCVKANLRRWVPRLGRTLKNDRDLPMVVWAVARRPAQ